MNPDITTEAGAVADLASRTVLAAAGERPIQRTAAGGKPFTFLLDTEGAQKLQSLEALEPPRKKAVASFVEMASFVEYVNAFADGRARLFCDVDKRSFTAIFDYHESTAEDAAGCHAEHRAGLTLRLTPAMEAWMRLAKEPVSQAALAEFLEDRFRDISEPAGADVLELAKTLEVKNNVAFKSTQRRSDGGYDLNYEEAVSSKAGQQGTMEIPSKFTLAIGVFQGGNQMSLPMRLRFALRGGSVWFSLTFLNLEELIREEVDDVRDQIAEGTKRPVWAGTVTI